MSAAANDTTQLVSTFIKNIKQNNFQKVKQLLEQIKDNGTLDYIVNLATTNDGLPLIALASKVNNIEIVKLLVKYNGKVNNRVGYGRTALHYASKNNNLDMVSLLMKNAANPNIYAESSGVTLY